MVMRFPAPESQKTLQPTIVPADTRRMGFVVRFAFLAALVAAGLFLVQRQQVLQHAGLVGHCSRIATPQGRTGYWHECIPGKLTGMPGLSLSSCKRVGHSPTRDVWRCPTELESNKTRQ
jgi:hypothetical protein